MKKKKILLIITLVVALCSTAAFVYLNNNNDSNDTASVGSKSKDNSDEPLVKLSVEEQEEIYNNNIETMNTKINGNVPYVIDEELGVYMPTRAWNDSMNVDDENEVLNNYALTYPEYGSPGEGNYIVFGHNTSGYSNGYFTPFIDGLKVGDIVTVRTKEKDYDYEIKERKVVDKNDNDQVYYTSPDKSIITIGTCEIPTESSQNRIIWTGELV